MEKPEWMTDEWIDSTCAAIQRDFEKSGASAYLCVYYIPEDIRDAALDFSSVLEMAGITNNGNFCLSAAGGTYACYLTTSSNQRRILWLQSLKGKETIEPASLLPCFFTKR